MFFSTHRFNLRIFAIALLGFSSGLPLSASGSTLQGWYTVAGVSIVSIGFLGLVGLPYTLKFLWSPILDRYVPPWLGRRRGWILLSQISLFVILVAMAFCNPATEPTFLGFLALLLAFLSATQDIAIDAYRADVLVPDERGIGTSWFVAAYRIAMLVSGAAALIMADYIGWNNTYLVLAGLMGIGVIASFLGPDPQQVDNRPTTLLAAVVEPFQEFVSRPNAYAILLLIVLYKWADAFAFSLNTTFLLRELQFSLTEIGTITKGVGFAATLAGVFIGGILLNRLGLFRSLILFGFAQAIANLTFLLLAMVGKDYSLMATAIFLENFCAGMGTTAFLAFLMSLCHPRYTATQFALFTALSAVGRVIVGPIAGMMVESIGWISFYSWAFVLAFPALILLWWLRHGFQINFQSSTPRITDDNQ